MKDLTIATFISNNEKYNEDFLKFSKELSQKLDVEILIFTDKKVNITDNQIKQIIKDNTTKYKRIIELIKICNSKNILCIDNDITINHKELTQFIEEFLSNDYELAWGKIKSKYVQGIVPNLIRIDKNLSHDFIRPLLWRINLGISVPGQIFMMKRDEFFQKLPKKDTVYDDLTIGMIARKNKFKVYYSKLILGNELPKGNFKSLITQRKRWAKGLAQSIKNGKSIKMLKFVLIHGFMYHFLWIFYYLILTLIGINNTNIAIILFLITGVLLAEFKIKDLLWSVSYMLIFPIIHTIWCIAFIKNIFVIY